MSQHYDSNKSKCLIKEPDASEIIPGLWLGNYGSSLDLYFLKHFNIKYILRIHEDLPAPLSLQYLNPNINLKEHGIYNYKYASDGIQYFHIPIRDSETCILNMHKLFDKTTEFIHQVRLKSENMLVHCKRGHHRSAAVVAAYLIKYLGHPYQNVVRYINQLRPCALRRSNCMTNGLFKYYLSHENRKCKRHVCVTNKYYMCHCI